MSITSMSARAGMAQKLSIPQLQQAIQDGVIPPYVGVPLLQEKVKMAKLAQAAQAAAQQPSVTQQVMDEAQQVEQGVPTLPTNLPAAMAGGGIVAFADGGLYDDEDTDEDRIDAAREADLDAAMQEAMDVRETLGLMPTKGSEDSYHAVRINPKGGEFEALAMEKNKKHGVDERLLRHVMHKETGNLKDRAHAVSPAGAQGVMQLMPATAKSLGVKDAFDPEQNIEGGVKFLAQLERKYKDPKLAAMAYNWGPGNVDKWLMAGADMSKLPKETRNYVQGLAHGGEVKHFEAGGFNPNTGEFEYDDDVKRELLGEKFMRAGRAAGDYIADAINYKKGLTAGDTMPGMAKAKEQVAAALAARNGTPTATSPMTAADEKMFSAATDRYMADRAAAAAQANKPAAANVENVPTTTPTQTTPVAPVAEAAAKPDPYAEFKDLFAKREANLAKQKEQDKYMAMLSAGLGMMGGTSRHAMANIGAGAQQGIQSLAHARAANTAEENALLSGRLGLAKIGATQEQALAAQQLRKDIFNAQNSRLQQAGAAALEEKQAARISRDEDKALRRLADINKTAEIMAEKSLASDPKNITLTDAQRATKKAEMVMDILRRDPVYTKNYQIVHGQDADPFQGYGQSGTINFGAVPPDAVRKIKG